MLGADDDRQAGAVDVFVQQADQPLLFFDHLQQRLQRAERQPVRFVEQRRGAFDVDVCSSGRSANVEVASRMRARHQRVVEQPLLVASARAPLRARGAAAGRRTRRSGSSPPGAGRRRSSGSADLDHFLHARGRRCATITTSTRDALSGTNSTRSNTAASCAGRTREADAARRLRHARATPASSSESSSGAGAVAPQPRLDRAGGAVGSLALRAAGRRRTGSRDRSGCGRPRYAAAGRTLLLRAARGCCAPSPTTRRGRPRVTSSDEATGSPDAMYSRTSAASTRLRPFVGLPLALGSLGDC